MLRNEKFKVRLREYMVQNPESTVYEAADVLHRRFYPDYKRGSVRAVAYEYGKEYGYTNKGRGNIPDVSEVVESEKTDKKNNPLMEIVAAAGLLLIAALAIIFKPN